MKIYIGNLPKETTEDTLREWLAESGYPPYEVYIPRNSLTKIQKNFAFAKFSKPLSEAELLALRDLPYRGIRLHVDLAKDKPKRSPGTPCIICGRPVGFDCPRTDPTHQECREAAWRTVALQSVGYQNLHGEPHPMIMAIVNGKFSEGVDNMALDPSGEDIPPVRLP